MGNGVPTWKSKSGPLDNDGLDTLYPLDGLYRQGKRNKWLLDNITVPNLQFLSKNSNSRKN